MTVEIHRFTREPFIGWDTANDSHLTVQRDEDNITTGFFFLINFACFLMRAPSISTIWCWASVPEELSQPVPAGPSMSSEPMVTNNQ